VEPPGLRPADATLHPIGADRKHRSSLFRARFGPRRPHWRRRAFGLWGGM